MVFHEFSDQSKWSKTTLKRRPILFRKMHAIFRTQHVYTQRIMSNIHEDVYNDIYPCITLCMRSLSLPLFTASEAVPTTWISPGSIRHGMRRAMQSQRFRYRPPILKALGYALRDTRTLKVSVIAEIAFKCKYKTEQSCVRKRIENGNFD